MTLIPGDGIGEEITDSVKEIFEHMNAPIEWEQYNVSGVSSTGESLFRDAVESLKRNRVGLKGRLFRVLYTTQGNVAQAFSSHRYRKEDTFPGTLPCASNSISMRRLSFASQFLVFLPDTRM